MNILANLEKALLTEIAVDFDKETLAPDEDLIEQGIIDSLGIMKLMLYIEETFGIKIDDEDVVPDNFQCLNSMVRLIEQKMRNN